MFNNGKAKIEKTIGGLNVTVPSKKNWFALLFGTAWIGGWFYALRIVSGMLFSSDIDHSGVTGFIAFWFLCWIIGGRAITFILLWGYFRQEKFTTDRSQIVFEKSIFGIGKKNRFGISAIKNFRT
ncbi:MAG: hypothetical protein GC181_16120 [Bacteroidetes bacterium]|nr:hypothetical protein [Bacteroidota bacterium]